MVNRGYDSSFLSPKLVQEPYLEMVNLALVYLDVVIFGGVVLVVGVVVNFNGTLLVARNQQI